MDYTFTKYRYEPPSHSEIGGGRSVEILPVVLEFSDEDNAGARGHLVNDGVGMPGLTGGSLPMAEDLSGEALSCDEEYYLGYDERKIRTRCSEVVNTADESKAKVLLRKRKKAICIREENPVPVVNANELRLKMTLIDSRSDSMLAKYFIGIQDAQSLGDALETAVVYLRNMQEGCGVDIHAVSKVVAYLPGETSMSIRRAAFIVNCHDGAPESELNKVDSDWNFFLAQALEIRDSSMQEEGYDADDEEIEHAVVGLSRPLSVRHGCVGRPSSSYARVLVHLC
jgi:hypothetical protein